MVALLVNPAMSCSSGNGVHYEYGQAEMAAGVAGPWRVTLQRSTGTVSATFTLEPGSLPSATGQSAPVYRMQCSSREFIADAGACMDISTLYVTGTFTGGDPSLLSLPITGNYFVSGTTYLGGDVDLQLGDQLSLTFLLDQNNAATSAYASDAGARITASVVRAP